MSSNRRNNTEQYFSEHRDDFFKNSHEFYGRPLSIKDFKIGTTLGTGTFGRVRQAMLKRDTSRQTYALKILKKTTIMKLNQLDHIKSEKTILSKIAHPFIVRV